jgi:hypothetical protein
MRSFVFGTVALVSAAALSACGNAAPTAGGAPSVVAYQTPSATPSASASAGKSAAPTGKPGAPTGKPGAPSKTAAARKAAATSDVSQLKRLGIDLNEGVLIDVADDGKARWLQIGKTGVDFTGTTKTDSTMMSLKAAPVSQKNRVLIKPPFWNEDLGPGSCVADTAGAALKLETCASGKPAQVWTVVPAGDSGQFELRGTYGIIRVENGKITTGTGGRTGLQTIPFAK